MRKADKSRKLLKKVENELREFKYIKLYGWVYIKGACVIGKTKYGNRESTYRRNNQNKLIIRRKSNFPIIKSSFIKFSKEFNDWIKKRKWYDEKALSWRIYDDDLLRLLVIEVKINQ
ncbi:MAG: hypothetical protein ACTSUE_22265 [Promethearchaeota archaeon]